MSTQPPQSDRPAERNGAVIELRLLGPPEVLVDEKHVKTSRKALGLVAYLALSRCPVPRERLVALLWPESSEPVGRSALRNALSELRGVVGEALEADRSNVTLRVGGATGVRLDVALLDEALGAEAAAKALLERSVAACRGVFLDGLHGDDASELDDWITGQRATLLQRATQVLTRCARAQASAGDLRAAIETARRHLTLDPLNEPAHRLLIELHFAAGDRDAAVRAYETCRALLARELGTNPAPETKALAERVLREAPPSPPRPRTLPVPPTAIIGREAELEALEALVTEPGSRIVTLLGPGGVGKTRLSIELATRLTPRFARGPWFVALAPVVEASLVLPTLARVLGVSEDRARSPLDQIAESLGDERALVVVDNLEHLVDAAPTLGELSERCPGLTLLVTSRRLLRLRGERSFVVSPLSVASGEESPAVRLFVERAREVARSFSPRHSEMSDLRAICERLDGLPLAIELAAARSRTLGPSALLARLEARLPLLTGGPRDAPARQRTLRDAIAWSYDLLTDPERQALRGVSIFAGRFTLDAAEGVTGHGIDVVESLVDQSLVARAPEGDAFFLLETVREFAGEQLDAAGERPALRRRHARWFVERAESSVAEFHGSRQAEVLAAFEADIDNLRAALEACLGGEVEEERRDALRIAGDLTWFWHLKGHWREGRRYLSRALESVAEDESVTRGRALYGAGVLACAQEDFEPAVVHLDAALRLLPRGTDRVSRAHALGFRSVVGIYKREVEGLEPLLDESLTLFREAGDRWGEALTLLRLGIVAGVQERWEPSVRWCSESHRVFEGLSNPWGVGMALANLAEARFGAGDVEGAHSAYRDSLAQLGALGSPWYLTLSALGWAGVIAARGDASLGAMVLGAAHAGFTRTRGAIAPLDRFIYERNRDAVRATLGDSAFDVAWAEGEAAGLDAVLARARG